MEVEALRQVLLAGKSTIPVLFHANRSLEADTYCVGTGAVIDSFWDGAKGWQPCVMVELGEEF